MRIRFLFISLLAILLSSTDSFAAKRNHPSGKAVTLRSKAASGTSMKIEYILNSGDEKMISDDNTGMSMSISQLVDSNDNTGESISIDQLIKVDDNSGKSMSIDQLIDKEQGGGKKRDDKKRDDKKRDDKKRDDQKPDKSTTTVVSNNAWLVKLKTWADTWINVPYRSGGMSKSGTDCSGFSSQLYKNVFNITLQRQSKLQYQNDCYTTVKKTDLQVGDLLFFVTNGKSMSAGNISHVGVYVGGDKKIFVHSSTSRGVIYSSLDEAYYLKTYLTAGRVVNFVTEN